MKTPSSPKDNTIAEAIVCEIRGSLVKNLVKMGLSQFQIARKELCAREGNPAGIVSRISTNGISDIAGDYFFPSCLANSR